MVKDFDISTEVKTKCTLALFCSPELISLCCSPEPSSLSRALFADLTPRGEGNRPAIRIAFPFPLFSRGSFGDRPGRICLPQPGNIADFWNLRGPRNRAFKPLPSRTSVVLGVTFESSRASERAALN
jgi:hypothetical protein